MQDAGCWMQDTDWGHGSTCVLDKSEDVNMNLRELFQEIESYKFAAYLGIASDLKTFLRIAQQQKVVHALLDALKSVKSQHRVISRIHELSRDEEGWLSLKVLHISYKQGEFQCNIK
jgi:hypothetical protein